MSISDSTAEQSLLGALIISPHLLPEIEALVSPKSFYIPANGIVFKAMQTLMSEGVDLDIVTLRNRLDLVGQLQEIGGLNYLMSVADFVPTAHHAMSYAKLIREAYAKRVCIETVQKTMHEIMEEGADPLASMERMVASVESVVQPGREASHIEDIVSPEVDEILNRTTGGRGIPTGLSNIDKITHGFRPGEFSIIGARPSMGKSALALQIAHTMAKNGTPVLYVSIEMSRSMVAQRLISYTTGIDGSHVANGILDNHEKQAVVAAKARLNTLPIYISAHSPCDMSLIKSMVSRLKRTAGIKCVFVDYLQMIDGGNSDNRTREVGIISRSLKAIAKEFDVAVIALSSLSRRVESRDDKRPIMSDLRESGDIESDADLVTFLYRPMYYADPDQKEGLYDEECEFIVSKNRNGPTGTGRLTFFNTKATFDDAADMGGF